jgi:hypothetical protein
MSRRFQFSLRALLVVVGRWLNRLPENLVSLSFFAFLLGVWQFAWSFIPMLRFMRSTALTFMAPFPVVLASILTIIACRSAASFLRRSWRS